MPSTKQKTKAQLAKEVDKFKGLYITTLKKNNDLLAELNERTKEVQQYAELAMAWQERWNIAMDEADKVAKLKEREPIVPASLSPGKAAGGRKRTPAAR
jgi:hypothetical protein